MVVTVLVMCVTGGVMVVTVLVLCVTGGVKVVIPFPYW